jgi:hypothetical protein
MLSIFHDTKVRKDEQRRAEVYRAMLHYEAKMGGELFGPLSKGTRREFFCLDPHTWVWHEEWKDDHGKRQVLTTRYDIRPSGVVKSQGNNIYQALSLQEAQNLLQAINLYERRVLPELQRFAYGA